MYVLPIVCRIEASTSGCFSNLPVNARRGPIQSGSHLKVGIGLRVGSGLNAALACASKSCCRKSFTALAVAASMFRAPRRFPGAAMIPPQPVQRKTAAPRPPALYGDRANFCNW